MVGSRGPMTMSRGPASAGVQRGGVHFVMGGFGHPGSPFFFHHHHRFFSAWPYGGYYGYPYYGYSGYYGNDSYSGNSYQDDSASNYSAGYENGRQQAEIDRLESEVDQLRQQRETRQPQVSAPPSHPTAQLQSTELVFLDKHTERVENYAIVGQTFWILGEQRARKIPLAQLDIPATKKANDDRGVDFQLPD
jgi:hypothetical protein